MKIDSGIPVELDQAGTMAADLEAKGYDGGWVFELNRDPFLPLTLAAEHTTTLTLGSNIAVAFARNPMLLANVGRDLADYSRGRFVLGLGTQIKAHITKRFGMPWSHPAARMREMIRAVHAIWDSWETGDRLDFRGDFYTHTLMTPVFSPGPAPHGRPPIYLAAVGPLMTKVAGEVADGWMSHGFQTESYLREHSLPALEAGLARSGRTRADITVMMPAFTVTGESEEELAEAAKAVKGLIGFYGSTPAYRSVLEHHGWGDAQPELNAMSKQGRWDEMGDVIDDEMLTTFAVVGTPEEVGDGLAARFGDILDRISFYTPYEAGPDVIARVCDRLRIASA